MPNAERIMQRCDRLARESESASGLTRVFLSPQHRAASDLVLGWMREAGMRAERDAIGNTVGRYEGAHAGSSCLMLGSHLDTVRDAGRYDGMLGVVTAIECVGALAQRGERLPFAIEVVGFGDEEGVRFGTTMLGSRAIAGGVDPAALAARDANDVSIEQALRHFGLDPARCSLLRRRKGDVLAYVELHIEQGPVLEAESLPVGVVSAINGFSRLRARIRGMAGHAGTVPMRLRRDALAAAAECVLAVERIAGAEADLVGTVGKIDVAPGAINVIPGRVRFSLDVRAPTDAQREHAAAAMHAAFAAIARHRGLALDIEPVWEAKTAACAPW